MRSIPSEAYPEDVKTNITEWEGIERETLTSSDYESIKKLRFALLESQNTVYNIMYLGSNHDIVCFLGFFFHLLIKLIKKKKKKLNKSGIFNLMEIHLYLSEIISLSLLPYHSLAMPFLAWMNSSHQEGEQGPNCATSMGPNRVLLQELQWQFEQRACLALEEERQHCSHGALGYRRPLTQNGLLALIPASECRLLERLCARIPPSHIATVLFRYVYV